MPWSLGLACDHLVRGDHLVGDDHLVEGDHLVTDDHPVEGDHLVEDDHLGDESCVAVSLGLACGRTAPWAWKPF